MKTLLELGYLAPIPAGNRIQLAVLCLKHTGDGCFLGDSRLPRDAPFDFSHLRSPFNR